MKRIVNDRMVFLDIFFLKNHSVNIKVTNEGVTKTQKAKLVAGVTDLLVTVLGKNPATTVVVIDEVETDNWGIGGELVTELRKQESPTDS